MPKVILKDGIPVRFHRVVIRFTDTQQERLSTLSDSLGMSVNSLVRSMVDHELSIYEKIVDSFSKS